MNIQQKLNTQNKKQSASIDSGVSEEIYTWRKKSKLWEVTELTHMMICETPGRYNIQQHAPMTNVLTVKARQIDSERIERSFCDLFRGREEDMGEIGMTESDAEEKSDRRGCFNEEAV